MGAIGYVVDWTTDWGTWESVGSPFYEQIRYEQVWWVRNPLPTRIEHDGGQMWDVQ